MAATGFYGVNERSNASPEGASELQGFPVRQTSCVEAATAGVEELVFLLLLLVAWWQLVGGKRVRGCATSLAMSTEVEVNPYELLNVELEADERTIRTAYRQRSLKVHPDRVRAIVLSIQYLTD